MKTNKAFSGVPVGTEGEVVRDGKTWKVTWELPDRIHPLVDWFTNDEHRDYLVAIK